MNKVALKKLPELPFDVSEALNQLRVNLDFCGVAAKTIMITSSVPNEGKSFVSMNLWHCLAQQGQRVLLIDCDLRNSTVPVKYGLTCAGKLYGLAHYLSGQIPLEEVICWTNVENGFLLPTGGTYPNPTRMLESDAFASMLAACAGKFDRVLVDTPPIASVADALKIATHCDGSLLVIHSQSTPRKLVMNSIQQLKRTGTPILGTVLSRVNTGSYRNSYYYSHYYRYGNEYGQSEK